MTPSRVSLAVLAFVGVGMGLVAIPLALWWAMTVWARVPIHTAPAWLRRTAGGLAVVLAAAGTLEASAIMNRWALPFDQHRPIRRVDPGNTLHLPTRIRSDHLQRFRTHSS